MDLEEQLKNILKEKAELVQLIEAPLPGQDEVEDLLDKITELQRQLRDAQVELSARKLEQRDAEEERLTERRRLKKLQLEEERIIGEHKRQLEIERKAQEQAERQLELEYEIEERTRNLEWRKTLMPHQLEGAKFLAAAKRALCGDTMGLGKTRQSIAYLDIANSKRALIICPGDIMMNFANEISRYAPHRICFTLGRLPKAEQFALLGELRGEEEFTFLLNYESWARNKALLSALNEMQFDTVILDEAHSIKTTSTSMYLGVQEIVLGKNSCAECGKLMIGLRECSCGSRDRKSSVENFLSMSGTLILNRPTEMYASLHLAYPKLFPSAAEFERTFCRIGFDGKTTWRAGGEANLVSKIRGFYIRRTMADAGIVLPPQEIIRHEIQLDPEQYPKQYAINDMLFKNAQIEISEGRATKQMEILALLTRQRQAAVWPGSIKIKEPVYDEWGNPEFDWETGEPLMTEIPIGLQYAESVKIDMAVDMIKEMNDGGHRVVVFSQFTSALDELKSRLDERTVVFTGETAMKDRPEIKLDFDRALLGDKVHRWDNILCNFKTGGVGLNLTAATAIIILDEEWNDGKNQQAYDRIHRMGQTQNTVVHILEMNPGIDAWMRQLNEEKRAIVAGFNNAQEEFDLTEKMRGMFK